LLILEVWELYFLFDEQDVRMFVYMYFFCYLRIIASSQFRLESLD